MTILKCKQCREFFNIEAIVKEIVSVKIKNIETKIESVLELMDKRLSAMEKPENIPTPSQKAQQYYPETPLEKLLRPAK